nr:leucine-rich repeat domain-containing protein [Muribaculaceae bacterium]
VLYHSVSFNLASEKISVEMTAPEEGSVWKNVDMSLFDASSSVTLPEVYKEHGSYGFKVSCGLEGMEPKVRIITADGEEQIVIPGDNGVYPITDLQGDVRVAISLVPADGVTLDSEDLAAVDADSAADIASIGLSGDVSDKDFETVRENFTNLETLDLSGMQNTSIPADAFTGMNNLSSVIIPDNVTEIGENAFSGCRNLESVSLSSVETIGAGAFSGCSSLTSISISSASGKPTRSAAGISDESFAGVNPNCLIFVPDASLALNGNIIYNANGTRRALSDINLSTLHPFNTPGSFSLAGKTIVLKATVGYNSNSGDDNWSGIILPFAPSSIESAGKKLSLGSKEENMLTALTFVSEDDEVLGEAAAIEANVPYMVRLNEQGAGTAEVTFSASGELTVQATPARETLISTGKDFTLFADYTGHEYVAGDYVLDDKAAGFVPVDTDNRLVSSPFAAYLRASNDTGSDYFAIGTFGEVSSVDSITAGEHNGNVIFREGSDIVIIASEATTVAIYNVAGTLVRTVNLSAGRNTLELSAGIYIIDGRKVIL